MKQSKKLLAGILCLSVNLAVFLAVPPQSAFGQDSKAALQRGYRTGYSDGYMAGYRDSLDNAARDFTMHGDYEKASRAYNQGYGTLEDYRDGYRQGFELGYAAGYDKKSFEANVPDNIVRRGLGTVTRPSPQQTSEAQPPAVQPVVQEPPPAPAAAIVNPEPATVTQPAQSEPVATQPSGTGYSDSGAQKPSPGSFVKTTFSPVSDAVIIIPKDTELIIELNESITTETAKEGDRFIAKIISPTEIAGAVIEGHIANITKPGRIKRRSEIQLSFNRIILNETRWSNFDAVLTEVLPVKGDNVKRVDNEGMAVGHRSYKGDAVKIGAATGTGVTIGAIAGGPVGAAVGAGVGAAFGVGAVVIERGKHIKLNPAQQLRIRTSYETQIR